MSSKALIFERSLALSHLFFADDSIIFMKANVKNCLCFLKLIKNFSEASGHCLDFAKSSIFFSKNINPVRKRLIEDLLQILGMKDNDKYMGLPSFWGRSKKEALSFLLQRISKKLGGWKQSFLSVAVREVLMKTMIQAISTYAMACFKLLISFCNKILPFIRTFR